MTSVRFSGSKDQGQLFRADYDESGDVLYIIKGDARRARNIEEEAGLILRFDRETRDPVGVTIIDFKHYWLPRRKHLLQRLANWFNVSRDEADRILKSGYEKNA